MSNGIQDVVSTQEKTYKCKRGHVFKTNAPTMITRTSTEPFFVICFDCIKELVGAEEVPGQGNDSGVIP